MASRKVMSPQESNVAIARHRASQPSMSVGAVGATTNSPNLPGAQRGSHERTHAWGHPVIADGRSETGLQQ